MRLRDWHPRAPHPDAMTSKVLIAAIDALALLGAGRDPACWVVWGDDPGIRYTILAPAPAGLVIVNVRVNVPGEGPRAAGKLVRWHRVQIGELSVETQGGHRLLTFQVEQQLLLGTDSVADDAAEFVDGLFAAMDGRAVPVPGSPVPATLEMPVLLEEPKASEP